MTRLLNGGNDLAHGPRRQQAHKLEEQGHRNEVIGLRNRVQATPPMETPVSDHISDGPMGPLLFGPTWGLVS